MPEENYCLLQGFEWDVPSDQKHWIRLADVLQNLKDTGIDNIWIPPACKGAGGTQANGYDIYDLYDLGEFDQKGTRSTKWGSKEELVELNKKAEELGIGIYFDAVLNHKSGADEKEKCRIQEVETRNRLKDVGEPRETEAWLGFHFPGRGEKYSSQKWHCEHFSGTDYDAVNDKHGIFRILDDDKYWSSAVGSELGNADFLMFANIYYSHPDVVKDVINWGVWVVKELNLKGFRFDACQHFSWDFTNDFVAALKKEHGENALFLVGEYWSRDVGALMKYLDQMKHHYSLFDSPLVYNISRLSTTQNADLRTIFDNTLVQKMPDKAVTLVMNHDTQPGQTCAARIEGFFKPLGYSLILLRAQGYPCVFYGDLYGIKGDYAEPPSCGGKLPDIILARKLYAYGDQEDYWDDPHCIGFVRRGTETHPHGLACVMSNAGENQIKMAVGNEHRGEVWTDILGWKTDEIQIDDEGHG